MEDTVGPRPGSSDASQCDSVLETLLVEAVQEQELDNVLSELVEDAVDGDCVLGGASRPGSQQREGASALARCSGTDEDGTSRAWSATTNRRESGSAFPSRPPLLSGESLPRLTAPRSSSYINIRRNTSNSSLDTGAAVVEVGTGRPVSASSAALGALARRSTRGDSPPQPLATPTPPEAPVQPPCVEVSPPPAAECDSSGGLLPEVKALHAFLQRTGGVCGGWDARDHAVFRRLAQQCGGGGGGGGGQGDTATAAAAREQLVCCVGAALPGLYSREEVAAHAAWDEEHEQLICAKRGALARWRAEKEQARLDAEEAARARAAAKRAAELHAAASQRALKAAELEVWRAQQQQVQAQQAQQAQADAQQAAQAVASARARAAAELAVRMEAVGVAKDLARQRKAAEAEAAALAAREARKAAADAALIARETANARVAAAAQKRSAAASARAAPALERAARLAKASAAASAAMEERVADDPKRLLAPTAAARAREQAALDVMRSPGIPLGQLGHRAVPSWRKGL